MRVNYLTDEVKSVIGAHNGPVLAYHPVEASEVRRFFQATMDPSPRYWDEAWARTSRYGGLVAPPAFPPLAFRRAPTDPDPLDRLPAAMPMTGHCSMRRARPDRKGRKASLVPPVLKALRVPSVQPAHKARKAFQVPPVPPEHKVQRVLPVRRAQRVPRVRRVRKVRRVHKVRPAPPARWDLRDRKVRRARKVPPAPWAPAGATGATGQPARRVCKAPKGRRERRVLPARRAPPEPLAWDFPRTCVVGDKVDLLQQRLDLQSLGAAALCSRMAMARSPTTRQGSCGSLRPAPAAARSPV